MKKPGNNQRPPSSRNNQRRNGSNSPRNNQSRNNNTSNRNTAQGKRSHTPHLWASAASSSTILTSHLSMVNRRNQNGGSRKNNADGEAKPNEKLRVRSNPNLNDKNQNNKGRVQKNYRSNKSNTAHHKRPHNDLRISASSSTQKNVMKNNKALESKTNTFGIDPFELFCAYHLGITSSNQYRLSNINEVANRFKVDTGTTRQILKEYGMDSASLLDRDFDMALAQLDIQVAPEGINRTELGRNIFEEFLESPIKKRDWGKIIEEDKKENEKTFGRK